MLEVEQELLSIDVLDENILLAGGASGGMFRSFDGGKVGK